LLTIETRAVEGRWEAVLQAATGSANPLARCAAVQAAFHTGDLVKRLPVLDQPGDLLPSSASEMAQWRLASVYYDLGYANMALHSCSEAMETWDERPILLQREALINLALGNVSTAKIYLKRLRSIPFQSRWAEDWLNRVVADPTMRLDPEVARLRQCMAREDTVAELPTDKQLTLLLAANPANRMAYEYLMTYFLLKKDMESLMRYSRGARYIPGFEMPPLWQEGLAVAEFELHAKAEGISPEVRQKHERITGIIREGSSDRAAARAKIQFEYADSYLNYYMFHK
jgi:hypothetical protein